MKLENKIAQKNVVVFDMEKYYPKQEDILQFDIKPFLFKELILKEDDFRKSMDEIDWSRFHGKHVVVYCSNNAIVPIWAFMIIAAQLTQVQAWIYAKQDSLEESILIANLKNLDLSEYQDERLIIKGCNNKKLSPMAYMAITSIFQPIAKAISFGEACSTVPIYRP